MCAGETRHPGEMGRRWLLRVVVAARMWWMAALGAVVAAEACFRLVRVRFWAWPLGVCLDFALSRCFGLGPLGGVGLCPIRFFFPLQSLV